MKYKWNDKVRIKSKKELECISEVTDAMLKNAGTIMTIGCLVKDADAYIMKEDGYFHFLWADEMIEGLVEESDDFEKMYMESEKRYEEEYSKGEYCHEQSFKWGFQEGYDYAHENEKLEINLKNGYEFRDDNGNVINATKIVLEKKKKEYPKTYEECCEALEYIPHTDDIIGYKWDILQSLQKLLICRDAYWKIAGEEMGLEKPWEPTPDEFQTIYVIRYIKNNGKEGWDKNKISNTNFRYILSFPTEEMRDAFYENFKKEIEICKELL